MNKQSHLYSRILEYLLPVLLFTFGFQMLRVFIPGLAWYLRDTAGTSIPNLIPYAFGPFLLGFLAALVLRLLGYRRSLWFTGGGLAVIRLVEQFTSDAGVDFGLAAAGVFLFLNFISIFLGYTRLQGKNGAQRWVYGLVLGLGFDTALRGIFGPQELSIIAGFNPMILVVVMTVLVLVLLWKEPGTTTGLEGDIGGNQSTLLLAIGPFLVLQLLCFQSSGWVEEVAGLGFPIGFLIVMLGYLIMAVGAGLGFARPRSLHPLIGVVLTIYLVYAAYTADDAGGLIYLMVLLGQFFLGWGLAAIASVNSQANKAGLRRTTAALTGGMLLFLILVFGYYVAQEIALPFPRQVFPAVAGALAGLMITFASLQTRSEDEATWDYSGVISAAGLVLVPLVFWVIAGSIPKAQDPPGFPIKVLDYNIHSAFHVDGHQDLEGIARVIEDSGADIIGLQEVSRVRLMDSSADMPTWLSRRLDMPYLFRGTEEPIWGNAILSRYPILEAGWGDLPQDGTLIKRGYLWARIDIGEDEPLLFIVTHLHHRHFVENDDLARQAQVADILEFWNDEGHTVLVGDLNAEPDSTEIGLLYDSGMLDAWKEAGVGLGYTDPSFNPYKRIDYIWHSPDLETVEIEVIQTQASDHLPVLATIH